MSTPLLTIGISVYNAARDLPMALASVVAQTFTDWELLVVDDGSSDGSQALLEQVRHPQIRLLKSDGVNRGLAARLNQIVGEARGRYIARMDADDLMHPERCARQLDLLSKHPDLDGVGCGIVVLDNNFVPTGVRELPATHEQICADPLHGIALAHATFVGRTEWFRAHPYNEQNRACEDWELWFSSYHESRFANLRAPLYFYREFSSYNLRGYLRGKSRLADLLWRRRREFGVSRVVGAMAMHGVRAAINVAACAGGGRDFVLRRRSGPLTADARRLVAETLPVVEQHARALFGPAPGADIPEPLKAKAISLRGVPEHSVEPG